MSPPVSSPPFAPSAALVTLQAEVLERLQRITDLLPAATTRGFLYASTVAEADDEHLTTVLAGPVGHLADTVWQVALLAPGLRGALLAARPVPAPAPGPAWAAWSWGVCTLVVLANAAYALVEGNWSAAAGWTCAGLAGATAWQTLRQLHRLRA